MARVRYDGTFGRCSWCNKELDFNLWFFEYCPHCGERLEKSGDNKENVIVEIDGGLLRKMRVEIGWVKND
jgi:Zn finger protein HypA/HybF involved in hydrogenase expression